MTNQTNYKTSNKTKRFYLVVTFLFIFFIFSFSIISAEKIDSKIKMSKNVFDDNEIISGNITLDFYKEYPINKDDLKIELGLFKKQDLENKEIIQGKSMYIPYFISNSNTPDYDYLNDTFIASNISFIASLDSFLDLENLEKSNYSIHLYSKMWPGEENTDLGGNYQEIDSFVSDFEIKDLGENYGKKLKITEKYPQRYISDNSPVISLKTNIPAECRYEKEGETKYFNNKENHTEHFYYTNDLKQGEHSYEIICENSSFNRENSTTIKFIVDTVEPSINLGEPKHGEIIESREVEINYIPNDPNEGEFEECQLYTTLYDFWELEETDKGIRNHEEEDFDVMAGVYGGTYRWRIKCIDKAGNEGYSDERSITFILPEKETSPEETTNDFNETNKTNNPENIINKKSNQENETDDSSENENTNLDGEEDNERGITGFITGMATKVNSFARDVNPGTWIIVIAIIIILILNSYYNQKIRESKEINHNKNNLQIKETKSKTKNKTISKKGKSRKPKQKKTKNQNKSDNSYKFEKRVAKTSNKKIKNKKLSEKELKKYFPNSFDNNKKTKQLSFSNNPEKNKKPKRKKAQRFSEQELKRFFPGAFEKGNSWGWEN